MIHDIAFIKTMLFLTIYAVGVLISLSMLRKIIVAISTRDIAIEETHVTKGVI